MLKLDALSWEVDARVSGELGVEAAGWPGAQLLSSLAGLDEAKVSLFSKQVTLASGSLEGAFRARRRARAPR